MSGINYFERLMDGVALKYVPMGHMISKVREKGKNNREIKTVYSVSNTHGLVKAEDFRDNTIHSEDTSNYTIVRSGMFAYNPARLNIGSIAFLKTDTPGLVSPMYVVFSVDEKIISKEYLSFFIESSYCANKINSLTEEGVRFRFDFERWDLIDVPVPPLEVQTEIVRILDAFTELSAQLNSELTSHNKQYNYYRDQLILNSSSRTEKLGDISDIYLGLTYTPTYVDKGIKFISAQNTSSDFLNFSNVKYISENEYNKSTSNAKPKRGDVLFTRVGSNLGHPVIVETDEPLCMFVSLGFVRVNPNKVLNSYIKHWMNTELFWEQVRQKAFGAAKINLNTGWLKAFDVLLPPLAEQERIVAILDKFDAITNSISGGLPREIALRQKQYAYYRDLLFSFPKTEEVEA